MSLFTDHVIPGDHGRIFSTNANKEEDLLKIKNAILSISGIKDVIANMDVFPKEFTIYSTKLVKIEEIENEVKLLGFHVIPKKELY